MMISVCSNTLWNEVILLAEKSKRMMAAIAYVTDDTKIKFKKGCVLIVDASDEAIALGKTSAKVLEKALANGAKLYSCSSLHAKTILFDDAKAYIGSANLSLNSMNNLTELGLISDDPDVISGVTQFVKKLKVSETVKKIDEEFIQHILSIEVQKSKRSESVTVEKIEIIPARTWIVALVNNVTYRGSNIDEIEADSKKIKAAKSEEKTWFWISKTNKPFYCDAKIGDQVITLERENSTDSHPANVYKHMTIQKITDNKDSGHKVYHYVQADKAISWEKFQKISKIAGLHHLGKGLGNMAEVNNKVSRVLFELFEDS